MKELLSQPFLIKEIEFNLSSNVIRTAAQNIKLENKQSLCLKILFENVNRLVTREYLFREVWEGRILSDSALNKCISILRSKLKAINCFFIRLKTVPKKGYILDISNSEYLPRYHNEGSYMRQKKSTDISFYVLINDFYHFLFNKLQKSIIFVSLFLLGYLIGHL